MLDRVKKNWILAGKKRLQHSCFPVKLAKFLRTSTLKNICKRLLLKTSKIQKKNYSSISFTKL